MKKRIVLLLSVGLMAAWLWGCGGQEAEEPQEPAAEETTEEEEAEPVEEETEEAEEETAQEAAPAGDIKPVETTIDSPAKLGDMGGNQEIFRRGQPVSHGVLPDHGHCERRAG